MDPVSPTGPRPGLPASGLVPAPGPVLAPPQVRPAAPHQKPPTPPTIPPKPALSSSVSHLVLSLPPEPLPTTATAAATATATAARTLEPYGVEMLPYRAPGDGLDHSA